MGNELHESTRFAEALDSTPGQGRYVIQAITPGWGSSGYYSAGVLEAAATAKIIPAGTHMYFDHASESERMDRPERSVRDLAAVTTKDATWTGSALVAEMQVFGPYRDLVESMKESIGLSISGSATDVTIGEAEGRTGPIIEGLAHVSSVDLVTHAGRGGKILQLVESARGDAFTESVARQQLREARNIGQWLESRLHLALTQIADDMFGDGRLTREERIALSSAVGDGLTAFTSSLEQAAPELYQRDLWDDPQALATVGETRNVLATRPGSTTPTEESKEDTMPEIAESELRTLREAAGRVQTLESERDAAVQRAEVAEAERDEARGSIAESTRTTAASKVITEAAEAVGVTFTALETRGLLADMPVTEAGELDAEAFKVTVDEAAAAKAHTAGAGTVRGNGITTTTTRESGEVTREHTSVAIAEAFGRTPATTKTSQEG